MAPDELQQAWQAETSRTRVTVDADLLLKQVQRNQRDFRANILRRDVIEVGVGLLMLPYWLYKGATTTLPWTWYLTVPAIIWLLGFFVVDRLRHPQSPSDPGEPLLSCVKNSLAQIEHQIFLLRNVFWWYLLPFTISIQTFFAHSAWLRAGSKLEAFATATPFFLFLVALYSFIDYLNQRGIRRELEPRRQELLQLLASLDSDDSPQQHVVAGHTSSVTNGRLLRRWLIVTAVSYVLFGAFVLTAGKTVSSYNGPPQSSGPAGDSLAQLTSKLRKEKNLVGLAAMVTIDGQLEAATAVGERKVGSGVPLEIGDRWHLGGITKSVTATMIARLIEAGQMNWTDTVGEVFADASVHEDWKPVTLRQLLTDTAGAPENFPTDVWERRPALGPECTQARREAVLDVMADKPAYPPGKKYMYSNVGYTIAGAMAEQVTGASWEDLVEREVFQPLGLTEAGFGPPKSSDEMLQQPRGHRTRLPGKVPVDDTADNTPIMGPAGSIHMSLDDLCAFAREHLEGELGRGKLLSAETYQLLHKPEFDGYACGWIVKERTDAIPYRLLWHNGSNTMWYALVALIPEKDMVVAATSNDGDFAGANAATWEIVRAAANQFSAAKAPAPDSSSPAEN